MKEILRKIKNILRILIMSSVICFPLTFAVMIVNAIMGIFIGLDCYLMMSTALTLSLTFGLVLFNCKKVFSNKKKIRKSKISVSNSVKRYNRREVVPAKRKIS